MIMEQFNLTEQVKPGVETAKVNFAATLDGVLITIDFTNVSVLIEWDKAEDVEYLSEVFADSRVCELKAVCIGLHKCNRMRFA